MSGCWEVLISTHCGLIQDVSAYLEVPVGTLYQWRHRGEGPLAIRLGRHLRYDPESVHTWALNRAS
jgi:excisionase family DNA binding protein